MPRNPATPNAQQQGRLLSEIESKQMLAQAGIPVTRARLARTAGEAARISEGLGYPVVLKIVSPDIAHKSDAGGVKVGMDSAAEVHAAFAEIMIAVKERQ